MRTGVSYAVDLLGERAYTKEITTLEDLQRLFKPGTTMLVSFHEPDTDGSELTVMALPPLRTLKPTSQH